MRGLLSTLKCHFKYVSDNAAGVNFDDFLLVSIDNLSSMNSGFLIFMHKLFERSNPLISRKTSTDMSYLPLLVISAIDNF